MAKKEIKKNGFKINFETTCGIILAMFAAILAVAGLGGNNTGKGQMLAQTEKGSSYEWYNSKSLKMNLTKGQLDTLESLLKSGSISKDQQRSIKENIEELSKLTEKYSAEEMEILEGSKLTALKKIEVDAFENEIIPKIKKESDKKYILRFFTKDKENKFYILKNKTDFREIEKINSIAVGQTGYRSPRWVQDLNGEYGIIIGANEWYEKSKAIGDADEIFDMANLFLQLCLVLGAISIVLKTERIKYIIFTSMIVVGIIGTVYTVIGLISSNGIL
jgi:hypothetical protein